MAAVQISVVMPVYNEEKYVQEAIQSILNQTEQNFELIIIDDGSDDRTASILASYTEKNIKMIRHNTPKGIVKSLNEGIQMAQGRYIARMDGDDIAVPDRFEIQLGFMKNHPDIKITGSFLEIMDETGKKLYDEYFLQTPEELRNFSTRMRSELAHPTVFADAEVLRSHPYLESYHRAEDYELFSRLCHVYDCAVIPEVLLRYRRHSASVSANRAEQKKTAREIAARNAQYRKDVPREVWELSSDWHNKTFFANYYEILKGKRIWLIGNETDRECVKEVLGKIEGCLIEQESEDFSSSLEALDKYKREKLNCTILASSGWYPEKLELLNAGFKETDLVYGFFCRKEV